MILVAVAILVGVFVAATGRGGELAYEPADHAPLDMGQVSASDVVMLRPPTALWGYNMQVTDEALARIAQAVRDRDVTIAYLQQRLADSDPARTALDRIAPDSTDLDRITPDSTDLDRKARDRIAPDGPALDATALDPTALDPTALDPTALDPTALDPTALDPTALDPTALDPTALDPTALDPTALDPTALDPTGPDPAGPPARADQPSPAAAEQPGVIWPEERPGE